MRVGAESGKMERYRVPAGHSWPAHIWVICSKLNKGTIFGGVVRLRGKRKLIHKSRKYKI